MEKENIKSIDNILEQEIKKIQTKQDKTIRESKNKNKKRNIIVAVIAVALAGVTLISGLLTSKKRKDKDATKPTNSIVMEDDIISIDDIGFVIDENEHNNKNIYGQTTGNINKDDLVEKDGNIWKDQDAADKSDDIGKTKWDDKNGELEQDKDGDIVHKDPDYEVQDDDGKKKDEGTGIPDGYAWDDVLKKLVPENEVGKYVYADATYYAPDGTIIIKKGDIVLKETLEKAKKQLTTKKPEETKPAETQPEETKPEETKPEETKPEETKPSVDDEGVVNKDGTYTIYGVTYKSKEDYHQFLLHPEQYGYYNGMILPLDEIEELFNQKQKTK